VGTKLGYKTQNYSLSSDLNDLSSLSIPVTLGSTFQNDFSFSEKVIYLQPNLNYENGKQSITLYGQLGYANVDANRSKTDSISPRSIALINPKVEFQRRLPKQSNLSVIYAYESGYNNVGNYNQGYILTQNRSLSANQPRLNESTENKIQISFNGLEIEKSINYFFNLDFHRRTQSLLNEISFVQAGTIENRINRSNAQSGYSASSKINKSFKNIIIIGTLNYGQDWRELSLNGQQSQLRITNYRMDLKTSYTMGMKSSVGFKGLIQYQQTNFDQQNLTTEGKMEYFQILPKNVSLQLDIISYAIASDGSKGRNTLVNIECGRSFKSRKSRLNLVMTNLTNKQYFISNFQDLFSNTVINTRLRDRQVLLVYDFKF